MNYKLSQEPMDICPPRSFFMTSDPLFGLPFTTSDYVSSRYVELLSPFLALKRKVSLLLLRRFTRARAATPWPRPMSWTQPPWPRPTRLPNTATGRARLPSPASCAEGPRCCAAAVAESEKGGVVLEVLGARVKVDLC